VLPMNNVAVSSVLVGFIVLISNELLLYCVWFECHMLFLCELLGYRGWYVFCMMAYLLMFANFAVLWCLGFVSDVAWLA
jgi:hypothetical protein